MRLPLFIASFFLPVQALAMPPVPIEECTGVDFGSPLITVAVDRTPRATVRMWIDDEEFVVLGRDIRGGVESYAASGVALRIDGNRRLSSYQTGAWDRSARHPGWLIRNLPEGRSERTPIYCLTSLEE